MRVISTLAIAGLLSTTVLGSVNITQGSSAPTYSDFTLTFDEPGGPTGQVAVDAWLGTHGISSYNSGDGFVRSVVDPSDYGWPWAGDGLAFVAPWGTFINFDGDLTEFSAQCWDDAGPDFGFGGGMYVGAYNDGVEVGSLWVTDPAWGGLGDTWFDFTTTGGSVFDEVRFVGNSFIGDQSVTDNLSWNVVPEPASFALLGLGGLLALRRR